MNSKVRDPQGSVVELSDAPLAQGGEAAVYTIPQFPGVVVKRYHPQILRKRGKALQDKIQAFCSRRFAAVQSQPGVVWPRFPVVDEQGAWCGYAMKKAQGVPMNRLAHAKAYQESFPQLDRPTLVEYLLGLLKTVQALHQREIFIGDYNLANFLCDPQSHQIALIDCDSWQAKVDTQIFPCSVAAPDMLPPELLGKELGKCIRTLESEWFSVAIVLFKTLMLGRHPYDAVGGASPVENIRNGYFPYGTGGGGIPKGPWYNIWSHLSYNLKEQFIRTFKEGARDPSARTPVAEWINLLEIYRKEMLKDWFSGEIRPAAPKPKEYRGKSLP